LPWARSYYRGGDPGKLLAIVSQIKAGDFESAWQAYHDAGVESRTLAEQAAAKRHNVSAREAYLWAAGYFSAALRFLDGTKDPERMLPAGRNITPVGPPREPCSIRRWSAWRYRTKAAVLRGGSCASTGRAAAGRW
jgi:hypothetical protein